VPGGKKGSMGGRVGGFWRSIRKRTRKTYCVFNKTRESFISLNVDAADTHFTRFRGLLGRMRLRSDEGIWVVPSYGVHTIGVPFSIDLIYLDDKYKVIDLIESLGSFRIGPVRLQCVSVLELPSRAIYSSQTQVGDELLICSPEEMQEFLKDNQGTESKATSA
jgi:uncharacterized membrane protein (UPF0127 family)